MRKKLFSGKKGKWEDHEIAVAVYSHKSVCSCGFPLLKESVPLGKRYTVVVDTIGKGTLKCGGCGATSSLPCLHAADGTGFYSALPVGIFNPQSEWER